MQRNSGSLQDQLASAMAAVELGGGWYGKLVDAEKACAETVVQMPDIASMRKEKLIGEGGYSLVWLVSSGESKFALKQMHKAELASRKGLGPEVAFREKQAYEEIKPHPFITRCYGAFQEERRLYLLLELCVMDLYELVDTYGEGQSRLQQDWAMFYIASISLALRHMHAAGYVYRDLKQENVLLDARGYVKMADMGAAKKVDKTRTFTALGTEEYIPPEQIRGKGRTHASDWWAVGVLLYELLMGRAPFEGQTSMQTLQKVAQFSDSGSAGREAIRSAIVGALGPAATDAAAITAALLDEHEGSRLGCTSEGFLGLANHPFFSSLDWLELFEQRMLPPHVPALARANTDFLDQVEAAALVAKPLDASLQPRFAPFGPEIALPLHEAES